MLKESRKVVAYGGGDWKFMKEVSGVIEIFYIMFGKGLEYLHLCTTYWIIHLNMHLIVYLSFNPNQQHNRTKKQNKS